MILAVSLAALFVVLAMVALFWLSILYYREQKRLFFATIRHYFESPGDNQPSEFQQMSLMLGQQFASQLLQTMKQSALGAGGVVAKNEARAEQAMMTDMLSQANPLLGILASKFPNLVKLARKNPAAQQLLAGLLEGKLGKDKDNHESSDEEIQTQIKI